MIAFLWFCIIAFVGFIFVEWGMQFTSGRRMSKREQGIIGVVNKTPITYTAYAELIEQYNQQGLTGSEAEKEAFKRLVEDVLVNEAIAKKKIKITDAEIVDFIKDNPPPQFLSDTLFQTNGKFDYDKYLSIISNPSNLEWLRNYELMLRSQLPRQILYQIITASVRPTTIDFMEEFLQRKTKLKVEYATIEPEVSQAELQKYYTSHKNEFVVEKKPTVNYAVFPIKLTSEDEMDSKDEAQEILNSASQGVPIDSLIKEHRCTVLAGKPENSGIEKKDNGWQISVVCRNPSDSTSGKKDSLRVNLFLSLRPSTETIGKMEDQAESFMEEVKNAKSDFTKVALASGVEVKNGRIDEPPIDELDLSYLDLTKKGKLIGPVEGATAFYVLQVSGISESQIPELSKIETKVKSKYLISEAQTLFKGDFKEFITSKGLETKTVDMLESRDSPEGEDFFMQAINIPKDSSKSFVSNGTVYVVHCLDKTTPNPDSIRKEIPLFYSRWIEEESRKIITDWTNGLKATAHIQDFRYKSY